MSQRQQTISRRGGRGSSLDDGSPVGLGGIFDGGLSFERRSRGSASKNSEVRSVYRRKTASIELLCSSGCAGAILLKSEEGSGEPDPDADIRSCNSHLHGHLAGRIASKVWDIGKAIGVSDTGNKSTIIEKLVDMEIRDREAAGNDRASSGKEKVS